jgi:ribonuclease Z
VPTSNRNPTSHFLNFNEKYFLIDCGEGTQIQLKKFKLRFTRINHIFISHLHGDHYFGLIGLISSFNLLGRKNPLYIYGPPQLKELLDFQLKLADHYIGYKIEFTPLSYDKPQVILDDRRYTVETIVLKHRVACCGFIFREKSKQKNIIKEKIQQYNIALKEIPRIKNGADYIADNGQLIKNSELTIEPPKAKSYAFCSDTIYKESIVEQLKNIDLLYHEATFLSNLKDLAKLTYHSTAEQAASIAKMANVGQLIIGHFSSRYNTTDEFLHEARVVFENTHIAFDGKKYTF